MSLSPLIGEPNPLVVQRIGEIALICVLLWLAIYALYDRGLLGPWPPSRRSARLAVWVFLLYPLIGPIGLALLVLLISSMVPAIGSTVTPIVDLLFLSEDLYFILAASLVYFRIMRWSWRGYGAAAVMTVVSVSFSVSVILSSLGLSFSAAYGGLELADTGWGFVLFWSICYGLEVLRPKTKKEPAMFVMMGHSCIEVAMRTIYGVIVPLVHRIRVDRDESALAMLKSVLSMDDGLERSLSLACKALGFDRMELMGAADVESALIILQKVETRWGNFSRTELSVLVALSGAWVVVITSAMWTFINGLFFKNFILGFVLFFSCVFVPVGMLSLVSNKRVPRPGVYYDLGKRHDEQFGFTRRGFERRRIFDIIVVMAALGGATCVTAAALVLGVLPSDLLVLPALLAVYVLGVVLLGFDAFVRGKRPSPEETLASIRKQVLKTAAEVVQEGSESAYLG